MGERGPKSLPANVHLLRGNASKKPLSSLFEDTLRPQVEIPDCPADLDGEARAEWNRITPHLEQMGLISQLDVAALTAYCDTFGEYAEVRKVIKALRDFNKNPDKAEGLPETVKNWFMSHVAKTPSGYQQISIPIQHRNRLLDQLKSFLALFGLSPADRSRVTQSDPQLDFPGLETPRTDGWAGYQ